MNLNLPTTTPRKKKPASYPMSQADKDSLKQLKAMALDNISPTLPYRESFVHDYKPNTANGLRRAIVDWLKFDGQQGEPINVTGKMVDNTKKVTDIMGSQRIIGSVEYQKTTMVRGSADISATIEGRSVKIELKINSDRQSHDQKDYQASVERAKGVYVIIKTISGWAEWYKQYKTSLSVQTELFT